jgi:hypothetical protein
MTSPRFLAALAVLFIAVDVVSADGTLESAEFLQVADALSPCPFNEQERFPSSSLPKAVSDHLWRDYYQPSGEERLPDAIGGFALDLNEDGNLRVLLGTPPGRVRRHPLRRGFKARWRLEGSLESPGPVLPVAAGGRLASRGRHVPGWLGDLR